jgi:hypothetical protein
MMPLLFKRSDVTYARLLTKVLMSLLLTVPPIQDTKSLKPSSLLTPMTSSLLTTFIDHISKIWFIILINLLVNNNQLDFFCLLAS